MAGRQYLHLAATYWCVAAIMLVTLVAQSEAKDSLQEMAAIRNLMEDFSGAEFAGGRKGETIRQDVVKYTKEMYARQKKRDPLFEGKIVYYRGDPLFVVGAYRVSDVRMYAGRATATVEFQRLARTEGDGDRTRRLIPECVERESVQYTLLRQAGRWWILDPSPPRVSPEALIQNYKGYLKDLGEDWLVRPGLSEVQREGYRIRQRELSLLESLRMKCGEARPDLLKDQQGGELK
jgi:hypothetical protein